MGDGPDKRYYAQREIEDLIIFFRLDFIQDYTLKSLRLKPEKWNKLVLSDGQREYILSFIEKGETLRQVGLNSQQYPFRFSSRVDHLSEYWRSTSGLKFWKLSLLDDKFNVPHRFTLTGLVLSAIKESSLSSGKPSRYLRMPLLLIT